MHASGMHAAVPRALPFARRLAPIAGFLAGYVLLDWVSYIQPLGTFAITPWNPPPGLALAFLLRYGWRNGPWLLVAALLADVIVRGVTAPAWVPLVSAAVPAIVYTAAAALLARAPSPLGSVRGMALFLAAALAATLAAAVALVTVYRVAGLPMAAPAEAAAQSWIGDFVGVAVTTPALLLLAQRPWRPGQGRVGWRAVLTALAGIGAAFLIVFGSNLSEPSRLFYVLFLPLVWIAVRHGLPGVVGAIVVIQLSLVAVLVHVAGPLLDFQFLMLALSITGLLLGSAVSERRRIEVELREKQYALDRTLRLAAASELASALAHELQQPLTALANYLRAAVIQATPDAGAPPAWRITLDRAVAESERAAEVVRRLRDFFRGGMVTLESTEPAALVRAAAATAQERASRHAIDVEVRVANGVPRVRCDRIQVAAVLSNLVGNAFDAVKHVDRPRRVRIEVDDARDEAAVRFSVVDTGPGVPAETAHRLFEHFATSKPHGLGLGLAISRSIVEAHGGRIWHEPGAAGAVFRFTLPYA